MRVRMSFHAGGDMQFVSSGRGMKSVHTIYYDLLSDANLDIAGSWWEIKDQNIEPTPLDLVEHLVHCLHNHQAPPGHWCFFTDQIPHGHGFNAIVTQRNQLIIYKINKMPLWREEQGCSRRNTYGKKA